MDDLLAFLRARLDEDEAQASVATRGPWRAEDRPVFSGFYRVVTRDYDDEDQGDVVVSGDDVGGARRNDAQHIARYDPARVLREVEAKRELINWILRWPLRPAPPSSVDGLLERLALPYADHEGYREEWKP